MDARALGSPLVLPSSGAMFPAMVEGGTNLQVTTTSMVSARMANARFTMKAVGPTSVPIILVWKSLLQTTNRLWSARHLLWRTEGEPDIVLFAQQTRPKVCSSAYTPPRWSVETDDTMQSQGHLEYLSQHVPENTVRTRQ